MTDHKGKDFKKGLMAIAVVFAIGFGFAALHYVQKQRESAIEEASRHLKAIADLKVSQIVDWWRERQDDAQLFRTVGYVNRVRRYLADSARSRDNSPFGILDALQQQGQYESVLFLDSELKVRYSAPDAVGISDPLALELARRALGTNQTVFSSLHRAEYNGEIYLNMAVPLCDNVSKPAGGQSPTSMLGTNDKVVGVILFTINAKTYLFPQLKRWPIPNRTAETLIVRREGDEVLYLNELRHQTNAAFSIRLPVSETNLNAVAALAASGKRGVFRGIDNRGVPVLAAVRPVPGRHWLMIANVDESEIFASARRRVRTSVTIFGVLTLAAVLAVALVWRNREYRFSLRELAAQRNAAEELRSFSAATFEGIVVSQKGRIIETNDQYLRLSGYTREQLLGQPIEAFLGVRSHPTVRQAIESNRETPYEVTLLRPDGTELDLEVRAKMAAWNGQSVRISAIRDISDHKRHECELRRLNQLYKLLSAVSNAIVRVGNREELFSQVCHAAVECGGFGLTWVEWPDPKTERLNPVASAGTPGNYTNKFVAAATERPASRHVISTVMSTGRSFIANDFSAEPLLEPWHQLAAEHGIQALGIFPLSLGGRVEGALTVHACEKDFFQASEVELLNKVSVDISFALDLFEQEAQRQRTEAALRQSESWLRQSQRVGQIGSYAIEIRTGDWCSSDVLDEILGLDNTFDKKAGSWQKIVHPDDWEEIQEYIRHVFADRTRFQKEFRIFRQNDEQERWVLGKGELVLDEAGEPVRVLGVIQDITERKQTEKSIRASRKRLLEIIESTPAGYFSIDLTRNYQHANPAWLRMHGFSRLEEIVGIPYSSTQTEADRPRAEAIVARVLAGESIESGELSRKRKDGTTGYHFFSVTPVRHNGRIDGLEGFLIDITERVELENQFRQAQKMEALGQLVGGVAHDFNNILTAVLIHLGLLNSDAHISPELKESLGDLEREAQRAASLTRQLLLFSRKKVAKIEPLELDQVIKNLAKMLHRIMGENIKLTIVGPGNAWVKADVGMMEQVMMNLCVNARDAMEGSGSLGISTSIVSLEAAAVKAHNPKARPGRFVCMAIKDTGCGMSPTVIEHIFEPFFTTKGEGKGTGLGLATVYGIVSQHEGWIEVESAVGQGSTFRVYIPCWDVPAPSSSTAQASPSLPGGCETILFVEDEPALRQLGVVLLRTLGYAVLEASTGAKALELWNQRQGQFDLLFTDLGLPGEFNGLELANRLRQTAPALKVLLCSGYRSGYSETSDGTGADYYLPKPYDAGLLAKAVRQCLDKPSRRNGIAP